MLIISGTMTVAPDGVEKAKAAMQIMMTETHKEEGCIVYEFSQVIGDSSTFRIYEEWRDVATLMAHVKSEHMGVYRAAMGDAGLLSRDLFKVEGGVKEALA